MKTNFAPGFTKSISRSRIKMLARTTNSRSLCRTINSLFPVDFQTSIQMLQVNFSSYSIVQTNNSSSNSSSSQQNRHSNPSLATVLKQRDRCIKVRWIRIKQLDQTLSTETIYFQVFPLSFQNSIFIQKNEMLHLHIFFVQNSGSPRLSGNQSAFCSHRHIAFSLLLVLELVELIAGLQFSGYFALRSEISDASTICCYALFVDCLIPTEKHLVLVHSRCSQQSTWKIRL